jgi:outer membrane protein TolC
MLGGKPASVMRINKVVSIVMIALASATTLAGCSLRPEPIDPFQHGQFVASLQTSLAMDGEGQTRAIDLYEALARALHYNQDLRAEALARMLGEAELQLKSAEMLPQLVASSQVYQRSNSPASFSRQLATGARGSTYSESAERLSRSSELSFSFNILDFGVSYFRARQAADRSLIAAEQHRRIANRIIEETRIAFWRTVALRQLDDGVRRMDAEMAGALANAERLSASGLTEPIEALSAQRDLINVRREIDLLRRGLAGAEEQLRALIHFPAEVPLHLSPGGRPHIPAAARMPFAELAGLALSQRPEIRQAAYEQRITAEEAKIAFLELFPSLNLIAGASLDQNPFLLNQGWTSLAARASWQLVRLLQYPARSGLIDTKAELDRQRTRALAVAVILQAQVGLSRLAQAQGEYATLGRLAGIQARLARHIENQQRVGRAGSQAVTRERMNALLAEVRHAAAYGEVQATYGALRTALGEDSADPVVAPQIPVPVLAETLRRGETAGLGGRAHPAGPRS